MGRYSSKILSNEQTIMPRKGCIVYCSGGCGTNCKENCAGECAQNCRSACSLTCGTGCMAGYKGSPLSISDSR